MSSRIVLQYLGRRGAMARFTFDFARAMAKIDAVECTVIIARDNAFAEAIAALPGRLAAVELFRHDGGAVLEAWRLGAVRRALEDAYRSARADIVVELMPHVWSPLLDDLPARVGARRAAIIHDWRGHPGDITALATPWLNRSALRADRIVTLSQAVAGQIAADRRDLADRIVALFHPDFPRAIAPRAAGVEGPMRVLFIGRLHAYKGLDLFVEAAERAAKRGVPLAIEVAGAGDIARLRRGLSALGARVTNRWLSEAEIDAALARCDVVAATYREASQSGVVALAFGAGRAAIVTPVGALPEQVKHGHTGFVAARADAEAICEVLAALAADRALLSMMEANVQREAPSRSMATFARALVAALRC
ncbi:MAG: glycosyltransferase family 4 protein [Hyphomonadaceae bacterium]|nr:glycosyltransferase family 4 protein [Hyphomonadaceae bacterium]